MRSPVGFWQSKTGLLAGVKKATACGIIGEVAEALVARTHDYIKWPLEDEMRVLADENNVKYGLPNLPLGVDGSLIKLDGKPSTDECPPNTTPDNFISRKGFPAINIQVVGDSRYLVRDYKGNHSLLHTYFRLASEISVFFSV